MADDFDTFDRDPDLERLWADSEGWDIQWVDMGPRPLDNFDRSMWEPEQISLNLRWIGAAALAGVAFWAGTGYLVWRILR